MHDQFCVTFCMCWLFPFVGTLMATSLVHGVRVGWRTRQVPDGDPHCSKCGYNLRGTSELRCAECGQSLQQSRVRFRDDRPPFPLPSRMLIFSVMLPGLIAMAGMLIFTVWPKGEFTNWNGRLFFSDGEVWVNVSMNAEQQGHLASGELKVATIEIESVSPVGSSVHPCTVDLENNEIRWVTDKPQFGHNNRQTTLKILNDYEILPELESERAELAEEIVGLIDHCRDNSQSYDYIAAAGSNWERYAQVVYRRTGESTATIATWIICIIGGTVVWVYGLRWLATTFKEESEKYQTTRRQIYERFQNDVKQNALRREGI